MKLACSTQSPAECRCLCPCGRRQMLLSSAATLLATSSTAKASQLRTSPDYEKFMEAVYPSKPDWYRELFAQTMCSSMKTYESEIADYKLRLFAKINQDAKRIVELGIGTGPNLKYYAGNGRITDVIGIDPNDKMEKYARESALRAGLTASQFDFVRGVGEMLPLATSSVDSVISTLVLCSVKDVASTLREIRRILRPGGNFLFIEHVAAGDGTVLRFWQELLDPVQQLLSDGCHLTRDTLSSVRDADFAAVEYQSIELESAALISPHIVGVAKA